MLNVKIDDLAQRDRLHVQLTKMRAQIIAMKETGPVGRQLPQHHRAILKSARSNARELAQAIKRFDKAHKKTKAGGVRLDKPAAHRGDAEVGNLPVAGGHEASQA